MRGIQINNDTGDLIVVVDKYGRKTLKLGETMEQCQSLILAAHPGEFKEFPTLGVGIEDYVNDNDIAQLKHSIRENLKADGMLLHSLTITGNKMDINATY